MAQVCQVVSSISIHALLAESDSAATQGRANAARFLSTLSLRRATYPAASCRPRGGDFYPRSPCGERPIDKSGKNGYDNFYPRSPCGERRGRITTTIAGVSISIHALLAESDFCRCSSLLHNPSFLSTLSLRRATVHGRH